MKTNACFHRERDSDCLTQCAENGIDPLGFSEETASRAFAVNHRCGATEIQINRGYSVSLQLARRANQRRDVITDHLRDDRSLRRILSDRTKNIFLKIRCWMNTKVFGVVNVGAAILRHQPPEWQISDILH